MDLPANLTGAVWGRTSTLNTFALSTSECGDCWRRFGKHHESGRRRVTSCQHLPDCGKNRFGPESIGGWWSRVIEGWWTWTRNQWCRSELFASGCRHCQEACWTTSLPGWIRNRGWLFAWKCLQAHLKWFVLTSWLYRRFPFKWGMDLAATCPWLWKTYVTCEWVLYKHLVVHIPPTHQGGNILDVCWSKRR